MRLLLLTFALVLFVPNSYASEAKGFTNGNKLHDQLQSCEKQDNYGCRAGTYYVHGIVDTMNFLVAVNLVKGGFCLPDGVATGQITDVVKNHLEAHPEDRHLLAAPLAMRALQQAFPCPE